MIIDFDKVDDSAMPVQLVPRPDGFICTIGKPEVREFEVTCKETGAKATATAFNVKIYSDGGEGYGTAKWFFDHPFSEDATRIGWEQSKKLLGACKLPNTGQIDTSNIVEWVAGKKIHATFKYDKKPIVNQETGEETKMVILSWAQPADSERVPPGARVQSTATNQAQTNVPPDQSGGQQVAPVSNVGSSTAPPTQPNTNPPVQPNQQEQEQVETDTDYEDDIPF